MFAAPLLTGTRATLWFPIASFIVSFVVVDTIADLVGRPYVSGLRLHLGMVMLAYIFRSLLFGWYGIFLGPILLVLVTHFARIVLPEFMEGRRSTPYAVDPSTVIEPSSVGDPSTVDHLGCSRAEHSEQDTDPETDDTPESDDHDDETTDLT